MKNIMTVFTGGTIGSKNDNGAIQVEAAESFYLIYKYENSPLRREVRLDTVQPLNILSENLVTDDWNELIAALRDIDAAKYDGIIVTHGSDTLAYSAAMLSYALSRTPVPIVLVASGYPLDDPRSNGLANFAAAVDYIAEGQPPGVFVIYGNDRGEQIVYLGTRITQALPFTDQFDSPYGIPYGVMKDGRFVPNGHPYNPTAAELRANAGAQPPAALEGDVRLDSHVLYIRPFPGIDYGHYDFGSRKPKAVLHDLYHSATASVSELERYSLIRFAERCRRHGVDLYLCPLKDRSEAMYASSLKLLEAGVVFIDRMSVEAALMKLMLGYSQLGDGEKVRSFVQEETVFFEHIG